MKRRKASVALAEAQARIAALEAELAEVLAFSCEHCGRALHPHAARCYGCDVDDGNAGAVIEAKRTPSATQRGRA